MDPKKTNAVNSWSTPKTPTDIRRFLGFTGYYRYFIRDYSKIARPLLDLTKEAVPWEWTIRQQHAFETLRNCMISRPVLMQPNFEKTFYLQTDASAIGVGAILSQDGEELSTNSKPKRHPIAYFSAMFTLT